MFCTGCHDLQNHCHCWLLNIRRRWQWLALQFMFHWLPRCHLRDAVVTEADTRTATFALPFHWLLTAVTRQALAVLISVTVNNERQVACLSQLTFAFRVLSLFCNYQAFMTSPCSFFVVVVDCGLPTSCQYYSALPCLLFSCSADWVVVRLV
jgi:hypothetical protein